MCERECVRERVCVCERERVCVCCIHAVHKVHDPVLLWFPSTLNSYTGMKPFNRECH